MKIILPIAIFLLLLSACSSSNDKTAEALTWLNENQNEYAFASNRFNEKRNAVAFVQTLYELGCENVTVTNIMDEDWRIKDEGGPYADTLIASLPAQESSRKKIFAIHSKESLAEGFETESDTGQKEITFWWD